MKTNTTLTIDTEASKVETPAESTAYYQNESGARMSIQAAITAGYIYRGVESGTVHTNNRTMLASVAVAAGIIGQDAADYIATVDGTNVPAPFTREDHRSEIPEANPADTAMESLGAFFSGLPPEAKLAALEALQKHLVPAGSI